MGEFWAESDLDFKMFAGGFHVEGREETDYLCPFQPPAAGSWEES